MQKDIKLKETISESEKEISLFSSNPMNNSTDTDSIVLSNYSQEIKRPEYDKDSMEILEIVRILNNIVPSKMPVYNFNIEEINGERYYRPDGTLLLIREYDSDVIRDYYAADEISVSRVLEHDKMTGILRIKVEPTSRQNGVLKTNITIFDQKVNNKYILIQVLEDGTVSSITEFTGKGKSFQTLFRNPTTQKPVRYLEGRESMEKGFEMIDSIFTADGQIARIKKYTSKREVVIDYTEDKKSVTVKTKEN